MGILLKLIGLLNEQYIDFTRAEHSMGILLELIGC